MNQNIFFSGFVAEAAPSFFKRLLCLFFLIALSHGLSLAQDACLKPDCNKLLIEVVRQDANVTKNCSVDNNVACGTRFRQMFYKVYLKYSNASLGTPPPFNLDYRLLNLKINLLQLGSNAPQHSYIDVKSTNDCYKSSTNGSNWSTFSASTSNGQADAVIFSPTPESVSINFSNINGNNCGTTGSSGNNNIPFTYTMPSNVGSCTAAGSGTGSLLAICAYAELFTIVVNVWPGEKVQFALDANTENKEYVPFDGSTVCELSADNTGNYNSIYSNGPTIFSPDNFASTANQYLKLNITGPTGTNPHVFELVINNSTSHAFTINETDFYVKITTSPGYNEVMDFSGGSNVPHEILDLGTDGFGNAIKYLHYIISGSISSMGSLSIGFIKFKDPTISNLGWRVSLVPEGGRLSTSYKNNDGNEITTCTSLDVNVVSPAVGYATVNTPLCTASDIQLKVLGVPPSACNQDYTYQVGLTHTTSGTVTKDITRLAFTLEFDMDADVSMSSTVDLTNWGNPLCSVGGCFSSSCYQVTGNKFEYCFSTTDPNAVAFSIGAFNYIKINFPHTANGCVRGVKITRLEIRYKTETTSCIPPIYNPIDPVTHYINEAVCGPKLYGYVFTETHKGIEDVSVDAAPRVVAECASSTYISGCTVSNNLSASTGLYGFCDLCASANKFLVTPSKNNNWLNGVSTYDLVLISNHILGTTGCISNCRSSSGHRLY